MTIPQFETARLILKDISLDDAKAYARHFTYASATTGKSMEKIAEVYHSVSGFGIYQDHVQVAVLTNTAIGAPFLPFSVLE